MMKLTERQCAIIADAQRGILKCFGGSRTCHSTTLMIRPSVRELDRLKELGAISWRADMNNYVTRTDTGEITMDLRVVPTARALASLAHTVKVTRTKQW